MQSRGSLPENKKSNQFSLAAALGHSQKNCTNSLTRSRGGELSTEQTFSRQSV